jgi:hypothetical protein
MRNGMRAFILALPVAALALPAFAESLALNGKFGYLGEYELAAQVTAQAANGATEFSGPLTVKHVGICSHSGPDEVAGKISLQFADARSRVKATLVFGDHHCTYSGKLSETDGGELVCSGSAVPFNMWPQ